MALVTGLSGPAAARQSEPAAPATSAAVPAPSAAALAASREVVSPGKFGPITMGVTTRAQAIKLKYLGKAPVDPNDTESVPFCWRDGFEYWAKVGQYGDFRQVADGIRRSSDKVSLWVSTPKAVTSKGLRTTDSIAKLKKLYPSAVRSVGSTEWGRKYSVYTVRGPSGYLDIIRNWVPGTGVAKDNFFIVRSKTAKFDYTVDLLGEGLGCSGRDY
jgi:hypothetical protein